MSRHNGAMRLVHKHLPANSKTYPAKLDWWILVLISLCWLVLVAGVLLVLIQPGALLIKVFTAVVCALFLALSIDSVFFLYYVLTSQGIEIHTRLRRVAIPYRDLVSVQPVGMKGLITAFSHKRFALSTHSLLLRIERQHWKTISVSPNNQDEFVDTLLSRVEHERAKRAPQKHHRS